MKKPHFPLFIDLSGKKTVVIGGGAIASRRVDTLLLFCENIEVIAPDVTEELQRLAAGGRIRWVADTYREEYLEGAFLVLAATGCPDCNEEVVRACRAKGIPVNAVHRKELCDFYFPAVAVRGSLVAALTASGMNHKMARQAREEVAKVLERLDEGV